MIVANNFSFGYNSRKLLFNNIDFHLDSGSVYGLLGRNGAGKTTLLKILSGLLFPWDGKISVNGFTPGKRQPSFLETIYFIPEEVYVPSLTVKKYLNLFAPFYPLFDSKQFYSYLEELDVKEGGKLTSLSFGQQKKFIIAFALACNTQVLLLDEPTNGLDIPSKARFRKLIASVLRDDRMIFISTHQVRDLDNLIDKVIIIDNGELLLNASISTVADKLCFKTVSEIEDASKILYSEVSLGGITIVEKNTGGEDSKVNLEHLFHVITEWPDVVKAIFEENKNHNS